MLSPRRNHGPKSYHFLVFIKTSFIVCVYICIERVLLVYVPYKNGLVPCGLSCNLLFSLKVMFLRLIHVVVYTCSSFIFTDTKDSNVWLCRSSFDHSPVSGYLGCCHLFAIMNSTARTVLIHVFSDIQSLFSSFA